ncbi:MAG: alpha-glucosidase domain-containing protein, partial [Candidatus Methanomethyliaceae archaeon]
MNFKFINGLLDPDERIAYINRKINACKENYRNVLFKDPAIGILNQLEERFNLIKNDIELWLTPTPPSEMIFMVTVENIVTFIDSNGCKEYADQLMENIYKNIIPDFPILIGVDHSLSGGAIRALCKEYGHENIRLIVFDSHTDFILPTIRCGLIHYDLENNPNTKFSPYDPYIYNRPDSYNADSFLNYISKELPPENIFLIGVSDYPPKIAEEINDERVKKYVEFYKSIEESKTVKVFITFVDPYIFNLKMGFDIDSSIEMTPMISKDFKPKDVEIIVEDREEDILISSGVLKLKITKKPFNISIYDSKDKFITQEIPYNLTGGPRGKPSYDHIPLAIIEDKNTGELSVCESYVIDYDEHFYGLGERGSKIDLKGQNIELWPYDTVGNHTPRMYKCVPFFMSSKGYGIYLNTSFPTRFDMGAWSFISYTIYAKTDHLDYFFIYGPRFKEILSRYTEITGKPKLPPKWSFGL